MVIKGLKANGDIFELTNSGHELEALAVATASLPETIRESIKSVMFELFDLGALGIEDQRKLTKYKDLVGKDVRGKSNDIMNALAIIGVIKDPKKSSLEGWEINENLVVSEDPKLVESISVNITDILEMFTSFLEETLPQLGAFVFKDKALEYYNTQVQQIIRKWSERILSRLQRESILIEEKGELINNPHIGLIE